MVGQLLDMSEAIKTWVLSQHHKKRKEKKRKEKKRKEKKARKFEGCVVGHAYAPNTWEVDIGGSQVQGQLRHSA